LGGEDVGLDGRDPQEHVSGTGVDVPGELTGHLGPGRSGSPASPAQRRPAATAPARPGRRVGRALGEEVFAATVGGDPLARAVVADEGRRIGTLVTAVAAVLDPELVVLAGGVGRDLDVLAEPIAARIAELGPLRPRVVASELGDSGVLLGAVARALAVARDLLFTRRAQAPESPRSARAD
jgi:predicted NBD/HSP70 family sugar kinase